MRASAGRSKCAELPPNAFGPVRHRSAHSRPGEDRCGSPALAEAHSAGSVGALCTSTHGSSSQSRWQVCLSHANPQLRWGSARSLTVLCVARIATRPRRGLARVQAAAVCGGEACSMFHGGLGGLTNAKPSSLGSSSRFGRVVVAPLRALTVERYRESRAVSGFYHVSRLG